MNYVNGFIAAVPASNKDAFIQHSAEVGTIFKEYGALNVVHAWGEDVPEGELTSFPMAVKCEAHEAVVFSWIEWPSKAACEKGWGKVMADPRMNDPKRAPVPFDVQRMIHGSFQVIVEK